MLETMKWMSAAGLAALVLSAPVAADTPNRNQMTADSVAAVLRAEPGLAGAPVQIEAREGLVTLRGQVASSALKARAIERARQVAGVTAVLDQMRIAPDRQVQAARYDMSGFGTSGGYPAAGGITGGGVMDGSMMGAPMDGGMVGGGMVGGGMVGAPVNGGSYTGGYDGGPAPEGPAIPGGTSLGQPNMPNYAWPSYAPHPNFSAVGYPTVYPWQAWPNIGPFYPYPEVPLDWRAVTLRWDDGLWWLDFKKHYTRPFFVPYPFGIFGY